jgi:hypothetical protein
MRLVFGVSFGLLAVAAITAPELTLFAYLGGSGTDDCDGIALDQAGDIYLACHSDSPDFPGLPEKSAPRSRDAMDAGVLKIDGRTGRLVWATRTGGSSWDAVGDIAVTRDGSIYALGSTRSADFPTTPDAVQRRFGGPDRDGILLRLDANGKIVYSTFLGGSANDEPTSMAVADDRAVFIGGVTRSADFPGSRLARIGPGGEADGFIARLRPGDPHSLQTVLLGGTGVEHLAAIALDRAGNIFVSGATRSADLPLRNPVQSRFAGVIDSFLLKLRASDWSLLFSTYLGGSKIDGANALALDSTGNPILSGVTESPDFPSTPSSFQPRLRGPVDAFVTKFSADGSRILWSTFYGGSKANSDQFLGGAVGVDDAGRIWLTGMTSSTDLPTRNPAQSANAGGDFDGFLAAFSSDGARLCYGSYLGGNAHDILEGLAIANGKVYVSGLTSSTNLRQTNSRVQPGYGGGPYDAIVAAWKNPADPNCR